MRLNQQPLTYESRTLLVARRRQEAIALDKQAAIIALETGSDLPDAPQAPQALSHLGDERQLRGIPVVGAPGVGGAITGTRPGSR